MKLFILLCLIVTCWSHVPNDLRLRPLIDLIVDPKGWSPGGGSGNITVPPVFSYQYKTYRYNVSCLYNSNDDQEIHIYIDPADKITSQQQKMSQQVAQECVRYNTSPHAMIAVKCERGTKVPQNTSGLVYYTTFNYQGVDGIPCPPNDKLGTARVLGELGWINLHHLS